MTETIHYSLISKEDLRLGRGTFKVTLADGREVTLSEIFLPEYAEDTGTTDAYSVSISGLADPYISGQVIFFKANTSNTGAATLNVNNAGAKAIKKHYNVDLADNDIRAGQIVCVVYDGTNFQLINHLSNLLINRMASELYAEDSGSSDAYAVTLTPAPTAYVKGMVVNFKANTANTGAATLNVNSLGAVAIKKQGTIDVATGDILAGQLVTVIYDGTNFQMVNLHSFRTITEDVRINGGLGLNTAAPTTDGDFAISGTMTSGTVPLARMRRTEASTRNSSVVIVTSENTTIVTLDLGTVNAGDRILIVARASFAKGTTGGNTALQVEKESGSASIQFFDNYLDDNISIYQNANTTERRRISTIAKVNVGGPCVLRLLGVSIGSDSTVATDLGQIYALVLNNG